MAEHSYTYLIVGGGLAAASAVEGIRERDPKGPILLASLEPDLPYDRTTLSKQLWTGAKRLEEITLHPHSFYTDNAVTLALQTRITSINPANHTAHDDKGNTFHYQKLLLCTGGTPRKLTIPGGDLEGISYFRSLADYKKLRAAATPGQTAIIIGGGFIGSELAASLTTNELSVTMIFPDRYLVSRVFPEDLGLALTDHYRAKGVKILSEDTPTSIERSAQRFLVHTRGGRQVHAHLLIAGIGITPNVQLAQAATPPLQTGNGIIVNQFLQSSNPDIYAAGDIAFFPEDIFGPRRIEHYDNAVTQGKHAGKNMAGTQEPFKDLPFFFSDLFEFGYEAVGNIDSRLHTVADWQEPHKTGVIYYLDKTNNLLQGAMMCNVWGKVDAARELIRRQKPTRPEELRGAIQ